MNDEEAEAVVARYTDHLGSIRSQLPDALRQRLESVVLHDAQFRQCTVDYRRRSLTLMLLGGDEQVGYKEVDFTYFDVDLRSRDVSALRAAVANPRTEILYDEIDVAGSEFVHRFLCWPYQEFDIQFRIARLETSPASEGLPFQREVHYVEIGPPAI
jgi:hypothetical protein